MTHSTGEVLACSANSRRTIQGALMRGVRRRCCSTLPLLPVDMTTRSPSVVSTASFSVVSRQTQTSADFRPLRAGAFVGFAGRLPARQPDSRKLFFRFLRWSCGHGGSQHSASESLSPTSCCFSADVVCRRSPVISDGRRCGSVSEQPADDMQSSLPVERLLLATSGGAVQPHYTDTGPGHRYLSKMQ